MPDTANALLRQYVKLTEFLGAALGPDYEVALHDLTDKNRSIIAVSIEEPDTEPVLEYVVNVYREKQIAQTL